ncbi:hypothetical protein [Kordiimonas aquimaris]|uniref:hypothetical protein n=1 Tax=Kordiimonas aquimaris TaxID=707591 RepID=UPI0021D02EA3|nr:hypothetical protein [Kordiimonas aquimaris]
MHQSVMIRSQYNGPPKSANGGYASGLVASGLLAEGYKGPVEVSLHVPPPLDQPLSLVVTDAVSVLMQDDVKIGTAKPTRFTLEVPALPKKPVLIGKPDNPSGKFEPFDICFVCGNARSHGDGLCLHAEQVEGHAGLVAAKWDVHASFVGENGNVLPEFIWSALDCPGYFACAYGEPALLARFAVEVLAPLSGEDGAAYVYGWSLDDPSGEHGRKRKCGTAIVNAAGEIVAKAEALWVIVDPAKIAA